jgi:hypothetical protein
MVAAEAWIGFVVDGGTCCICYSGLKAAFEDKTIGQMNNIAAAAGAESIMLKDTSLGHVTWDSFPNVSQIATNIARLSQLIQWKASCQNSQSCRAPRTQLTSTSTFVSWWNHVKLDFKSLAMTDWSRSVRHSTLPDDRSLGKSPSSTWPDACLKTGHRRDQRLLCHVS